MKSVASFTVIRAYVGRSNGSSVGNASSGMLVSFSNNLMIGICITRRFFSANSSILFNVILTKISVTSVGIEEPRGRWLRTVLTTVGSPPDVHELRSLDSNRAIPHQRTANQATVV